MHVRADQLLVPASLPRQALLAPADGRPGSRRPRLSRAALLLGGLVADAVAGALAGVVVSVAVPSLGLLPVSALAAAFGVVGASCTLRQGSDA